MTDGIDEELERRIVRSLDGQLSPAEQSELDRELLRNPRARRLMAEYAETDELAAEALDRALAPPDAAAAPTGALTHGRRRVDWRIAAGVAAAAAVALAAGIWSAVHFSGGQAPRGPGITAVGETASSPAAGAIVPVGLSGGASWPMPLHPARRQPVDAPVIRPFIESPRTGARLIDREFYTFFDEVEKKAYLFQLDRIRTIMQSLERDL